jgi:hypothetical protein
MTSYQTLSSDWNQYIAMLEEKEEAQIARKNSKRKGKARRNEARDARECSSVFHGFPALSRRVVVDLAGPS